MIKLATLAALLAASDALADDPAIADVQPPIILSMAFDQDAYAPDERAVLSARISEASSLCLFDAFCPDAGSTTLVIRNIATTLRYDHHVSTLDVRRVGDTITVRVDLMFAFGHLPDGTYAVTSLPLEDVHGNVSSELPAGVGALLTIRAE